MILPEPNLPFMIAVSRDFPLQINDCNLRCVYTCEFCARFRIKLAHFVTKKIFFITNRASLVRIRPRNRASVNAPLAIQLIESI
jgi:hypothetical protein